MFPFLEWFKGYGLDGLRSDALSGITVSVVLIPQAMAYAMLAGLPPVYGLYAAAVTPGIAALWGSLRQLATGPIAIMSLLVLTTLSPIADPGSDQYIHLAFMLSLMVGVFYLLIGLFRMGIIMSFISHSAVKGFTSAAAIIITTTQLPNLFGLTVGRHEYIFPMLLEIFHSLASIHFPTLIIGILAFVIIYGLKRYNQRIPAGLIALVISTIGVALFNLDEKGVSVVGKTISGLPGFMLPEADLDITSSLIGPAVVIALVSFAETYSVGKEISSETRVKLDVDQEFIGQGITNVIGAFFQCYPVSGSFSRTAINYSSGAKTGISSVISSLGVIIALLFLTPLLTHIPKAALAALVISAVMLLFHPGEVFSIWKMNRNDGIVAGTVFIFSLLTKPDYALLLGVIMSLMFFLWKTMHPRIVRETKDPEKDTFVNGDLTNRPDCPQILFLRVDNSIFFANAEYTTEHILERIETVPPSMKYLILDFQTVSFVDITGIDELRTLFQEMTDRNIRMVITDVHLPVRQTMTSSGFIIEFGAEFIFENRLKALLDLLLKIDHTYCRKVCPYSLFHECPSLKETGTLTSEKNECKC